MNDSRDRRKRIGGEESGKAPTLWQTMVSVLAAFFGVQSSANRKRDFTYGKASHFIVFGLIATVVLVIGIIVLVRVIMAQAVGA